MGEKLTVGVIGVGGIAQAHLRAIAEIDEVHLAAVMDIDADRARAVAETYGARAVTDLDTLLDDPEIEAVHVCTPHAYHADQVVAAAQAGKHVLVEKPMALSVADCDRMIDACEEAGKVLMVGQLLRHFPANRKARELIAEGAIGRPDHLIRRRYSYFNPGEPGAHYPRWYRDLEVGGVCVLYCFGPHEYDILPWYLNSPVREVYAKGTESTALYEGQKDSYTAMLTHENGAVSILSQSVVCHASAHDQYIIGSEGSLFLTNQQVLLNGEEVPLEGSTADGMRNQIREFADCCLHGKTPDASGRSVRHSMAVIEAAYWSAERGEPVLVSEFDRT